MDENAPGAQRVAVQRLALFDLEGQARMIL
jgi:hypothetical protein